MTNDSFNAKVLIKRNADGKMVEYTPDYLTNRYVWEKGNFSCDCNRHIFFETEINGDNEADCDCGEDKYSIQLYDAGNGELLVDEFSPLAPPSQAPPHPLAL